MNAQQKTAAVKKYTGLKDKGALQDEVKDLLKQDPKKYTAEEQKEILEAVFNGQGAGTGAGTSGPAAPGSETPATEVCAVNLQWEIVSHPTDISQVLPADQVRFIGTRDECTKFVADNSGSSAKISVDQPAYVDENWNVKTETPDFTKGLVVKFMGTVESCTTFVANNKPADASATTTAAPAAASEKSASPNDALELEKFDYNNLTGPAFKEYVQLVGDRCFVIFDSETGEEKSVTGKLQQNEVFDFQQFRAQPVFKARFPGMKDTPNDFNGIKLKNTTPEHTTRMSVATALEMNSQILNQHSVAGHGRYYLLKK